jgi:uncharacterized protein
MPAAMPPEDFSANPPETPQTADLWLAVDQFNNQQFYACHDTLEAMWMEAIEPDKTFYQGILQVAVALYHLGNHNLRGAVILLGEGSNRLRRYEPDYAAIDVTTLVTQSTTLLMLLQRTEPEQVGAIAAQVLQPALSDRFVHGHENRLLPVITRFFDHEAP